MLTIEEFLKQRDIQEALLENDLDVVYSEYDKQLAEPSGEYTSSLTQFLLELNINPLDYLSNLLEGLFCVCTKSYDCPDSITIYRQFKIIPDYCFWGSDIKNVIIEEGVESIRDGAFDSCHYLESITLPKSIKYIDATAFIGTTDFEVNCYENTYAYEWAVDQGAIIKLLG